MGHTAGCDSPAQRLDNAPLVDYVIPGHLCCLLYRSGRIVKLTRSYASWSQVAMRLGHDVARSSDAAPTYRGSILKRGSILRGRKLVRSRRGSYAKWLDRPPSEASR